MLIYNKVCNDVPGDFQLRLEHTGWPKTLLGCNFPSGGASLWYTRTRIMTYGGARKAKGRLQVVIGRHVGDSRTCMGHEEHKKHF